MLIAMAWALWVLSAPWWVWSFYGLAVLWYVAEVVSR